MIKKLRLMIIVPLISGLFACTGAEYVAVELGVHAVSFAVDTITKSSTNSSLKQMSIKDRSDVQICAYATKLDGSSWEQGPYEGNWIKEAKRRGLNVSSCNQITGRGF